MLNLKIIELKNSIKGFNIKLKQVEERTSELEGRFFEIIQSEDQRIKKK